MSTNSIDEGTFRRESVRAETMGRLERAEYWAGYRRGLRRAYHGERFGTAGEHEQWLALADDPDAGRAERGRGYRDGLRGRVS